MHKMTIELYFHESLTPTDVANFFGETCERIKADIRHEYHSEDGWQKPMDEVVDHCMGEDSVDPNSFYVRSRYTLAKAPDETMAANGPAW